MKGREARRQELGRSRERQRILASIQFANFVDDRLWSTFDPSVPRPGRRIEDPRSPFREAVCPSWTFDAPCDMEERHVRGGGMQHVAVQGEHALTRVLRARELFVCACGRRFGKSDAKWRAVA